jgi:5-(carboxyamino)imidazole ribonucleotide synthase
LIAALTACGGDGLLKTRRFGYDGKGQVRVTGQNRNIARRALDRIDHVPAILEGIVDFSKEISMIAARGYMGDIVFFDIPENFHKYGILQRSVVPANLSSKTVRVVQEITRTILQALHYVGVIAVEFFVDSKECVYVNEFAPRVHNSGHWTEAACVVSQFEQHIRAIAGWPLGSPLRHSDCVMQNLIGNDIMEIPRLLEESGTFVHHYGKEELRSGRKMGHVIYLS